MNATVGTPAESSASVTTEQQDTAIPGNREVETPEENGKLSRRDKGLERMFKMHTKFVGEQQATNKLLLETPQKISGNVSASADKKPDIKDFEKPEEFAKAIEDWTGREVTRKASEPKKEPSKKKGDEEEPVFVSDEQRAEILSQKFGLDIEITDDFVNQQALAAEKYVDFDEVVSDPKVPSSKIMSSAIIEQSDGAALQYFLSKRENRLKALELSKLKRSGDVLEKLKEIRELIGEDTRAPAGAPKSDPDGPISPVNSSRAPDKKSPAKENSNEYFARRQQEVNKTKRLY